MKSLYKLSLIALTVFTLGACKKDDTKTVTPAKPKADLYFSAKLDGADYLVEALVNGYGSGVAAPGGTGVTPGTYRQGMSMVFINPTIQEGAGITIVKVFNAEPTECSEIEAMYRLGKYNFGSEGTSGVQAQDGVVIFYVDKNKTYWSSDRGSADQTGSNFEIVEHSPNNDGFSLTISKAKFNCKLYDGQGNTMVLTEGDAKGRSVTCAFL